jgi:dephospho-CoA kinase
MKLEDQIRRHEEHGAQVAILDAPVLIKAGWDEVCDTIIYVDAPSPLRESRALARGWTQEQFALREAAQESLELKRRHAARVIDNSGSAEATQKQVEQIWRDILSNK